MCGMSLSHSGTFSDLEVIKVSIPGRNKKETCNGKQPWGSNGSQFTDNAGSSNNRSCSNRTRVVLDCSAASELHAGSIGEDCLHQDCHLEAEGVSRQECGQVG